MARRQADQALVASDGAPSGLHPSGFDPSRKRERGECRTCFGTGHILSLRSMFVGDGFSRSRCGICTGTGRSSYRDSAEYIRFQRRARIMDAALRTAPKGLDFVALGKIASDAVAA